MRARYIALAAWMLLLCGSIFLGSNGFSSERSNIAVLRTTLSSLDLEHPERDVAKNVAHGDFQFIGINGFTCDAPGTESDPDALIRKFGVRCLDGTSDVIEGEEHRKLIEKARAYAERYNRALKKQFGSHEVP